MTNSIFLVFAAIALLAGCAKSPSPEFKSNEVEWLKQEKINLGPDEKFSDSSRGEVDSIMHELFGSPDHARFPFAYRKEPAKEPSEEKTDPTIEEHTSPGVLSLENVRLAAGAVASDHAGSPQGLYREHCALCHGVTGDGSGPNAAILEPYPRDFRMGKFKFKSTPQLRPPTDQDLKHILVTGIPGTAMPSFQRLDDEELDALVDYVKYLSIRGQLERYLLNTISSLIGESFFDSDEQRKNYLAIQLANDDLESGDARHQGATASVGSLPLRDYLFKTFASEFGDQFDEFVIQRWLSVNSTESQKGFQVPARPDWLDTNHANYSTKLAFGKELFLGKGTCHQCHGTDGKGMGELAGYDAWTEDWIKSPGVDPLNKSTYADFLKAGSHRPVLARPRNLNQAIYRGGGDPETLYLRIANGIEGSPMPAGSALTPDEIWALVSLIKALPVSPTLLRSEDSN